MESTWESLSDRSERSSCFHQRRRQQRQEDDEEAEKSETQLRSSSGQREENRDSWEGTADILSSDLSWVTGLMNCVYYSENQQEPQGPPGETSTSAAARSQVCAAALFTDITCDTSVSVIDLWPLVPRKLSVEDHLKEAKKLKHKADATVFISFSFIFIVIVHKIQRNCKASA